MFGLAILLFESVPGRLLSLLSKHLSHEIVARLFGP